MIVAPRELEIRHFHLFCGLGGGARGFNRGRADIGTTRGRFRCIGGIDVDAAAIADFNRLAHARGTVLDLFSREQYTAFHGHPPPDGWREATPADIQQAASHERPNICFGSAPCKGFSGLLSESRSGSDKYQALNQLALRGLWLALEAWKDDPVEFWLWENVPRIATRGRAVLDQMIRLLEAYGYAVAETTHDCGELGNLAQSRKRFLLVARHREKVPPFLYEPSKRPLRAVGDVLGAFPLPSDPIAGPMHRMRELQWKTWVRLAFVEAGSDWRSLNKLAIEGGMLRDYGIATSAAHHNGVLGVTSWDDTAGTVTSGSRPGNGRFAVADPRPGYTGEYSQLGVRPWDEPIGAVSGQSAPGGGAYAVADPRIEDGRADRLGVRPWAAPAHVVGGQTLPSNGAHAVADPRVGQDGPRFNNTFRIVSWEEASPAIAGPGGAAGQAVADPRPGYKATAHRNKFAVEPWTQPAGCVTGSDHVTGGAMCVADPRPVYARHGKTVYKTSGEYGVVPWDSPAYAVTGSAGHDNGRWSVADPRVAISLPAAEQRLVAIIRALDNTWHRPFTTLELAALQGLVDPAEHLELHGASDTAWRERIGNAVPSPAAEAIASVMGTTLLLAWSGETFQLSAMPVWVQPIAIAISLKSEAIA